jgi:hypothetical protein
MFTIIGADGKAYGPVPADKVREWIAGGRANLQTKAQRAGEAEWKTLGDFPEFAPAPPVVAPTVVAATEFVSPAPEPAPGSVPLTGDAKTIADTLKVRVAKIDVFGCLGQSFELWKSNFLPLVGVTLLVLFLQFVIGLVPILGMFAGFFLNGVFYGGLYYYYLGKMRGEHRELGDAFGGFSRAFGPLALATLLTTVITLAVITTIMLICCAPLFMTIMQSAMHGGHVHPDQMPQVGLPAALGMFVGFLLLVYLSISWAFTFVLVIDKGLGPWTAMEVSRRVVGSQWFRVFFVLLFGGILTMLGVLGLFVGIFFTLPLMFGALLYAYEALFNPPDGAPQT